MRMQSGAMASLIRSFAWFFLVASIYDLLLGVAFFFFYRPIFDALGVAPPEDRSYLHLTAAFIAVQGLGYALVWRNPLRNVDLVKVGAAYKAAYIGTALVYLFNGELPHNLFAWFAVFDVAFLVGFIQFLAMARGIETANRAAPPSVAHG
ncbi:MAG: hypothetical protein M3354_06030 [Chloroflexota bacterium]|nr:hypothetical protein [Chloroflexota bacterium]